MHDVLSTGAQRGLVSFFYWHRKEQRTSLMFFPIILNSGGSYNDYCQHQQDYCLQHDFVKYVTESACSKNVDHCTIILQEKKQFQIDQLELIINLKYQRT